MSATAYKAVWTGTKCHITVEIEMATTISDAAVEVARKQIAKEMVEELSKSPEFQKGIRDLAVKRILRYLELED